MKSKTISHVSGSLILLLAYFTGCINIAAENQQPQISEVAWVYSTQGDFSEVKESLIRAIEAQGAVVSYVAEANKMLNRTASTLGIKKKVYLNSEIILFCKAEISHQLVASDPHALVLCPYAIAIYTLTADAEKVFLSIRKPPQGLASYSPVHQLLVKVINETLEF